MRSVFDLYQTYDLLSSFKKLSDIILTMGVTHTYIDIL